MRWSVRFLALAQVVLVLAACSAGPGTSSSPSPPSSMTAAPTDSPPPSQSPDASPSEPAAPTEPVVDAVRSRPTPTLASSRTIFASARSPVSPTTRRSSNRCCRRYRAAVVLDGPVQGFRLRLVPGPARHPGRHAGIGSIRSDGLRRPTRTGSPGSSRNQSAVRRARPTSPACPRSLETPYYAIACDSGREITFRARLGAQESFSCGIHGFHPWGTEPEWLDGCQVDPHSWRPSTTLRSRSDRGGHPRSTWPSRRIQQIRPMPGPSSR